MKSIIKGSLASSENLSVLTERKTKFTFCMSLFKKFIYSIKLILYLVYADWSFKKPFSVFFFSYLILKKIYPSFLKVFFRIEIYLFFFCWQIYNKCNTIFMLNLGTMKVLYLILYLICWWLRHVHIIIRSTILNINIRY